MSRVINRLAKAGAKVIHKGNAHVHVSGHAAAEELKLMLNLVQPTYFMPIHGETRHLAAHAGLAEEVGMFDEDVFILENGACLEIDEDGARVGAAASNTESSTSTASAWGTSATSCCATVSCSLRTAS